MLLKPLSSLTQGTPTWKKTPGRAWWSLLAGRTVTRVEQPRLHPTMTHRGPSVAWRSARLVPAARPLGC